MYMNMQDRSATEFEYKEQDPRYMGEPFPNELASGPT